MGSWGENTEESPVRAHLKLFHLVEVPTSGVGWGGGGGGCRRINKAVSVNMNLGKP